MRLASGLLLLEHALEAAKRRRRRRAGSFEHGAPFNVRLVP